jgi:ubiquinone/menaquinone biosynthesis C-methylase UbiE
MDKEEYKKNIEAIFNDVSRCYDENRFFVISASKMVDLAPTAEQQNILDLSTGTGAVAIEMACRYPDARIKAVDLSPGMLQIAQSKARDKGITNIDFQQGDVENMTTNKELFDGVTCGYGLFFYLDMEATYQAVCHQIKPGGWFIFSSFTKNAFNPYADMFLKRLERDYNIEPPSRMSETLKTQEQIEALASTTKFNKVDVVYEPIRYPIGVEQWWSLLNSSGFKSLLDQLDEQQLDYFKSAHLMEMRALSDDAVIELNADTLFGVVNF